MSWDLSFLETHPPAKPQSLVDVNPLLERLASAFGLRSLAQILNIRPHWLASYMSGRQKMHAKIRQRALDLHDVLTRAFQVFDPDSAMQWLVGSEPFLEGKRPIDVLALRGAGPVIGAINNIEAGGYA